jgi:hypothetical protein
MGGSEWTHGGCLDPTATGPYGGSRSTREEKAARRRNRGLARPPVQARWKNIGVLGLGLIPNRHKKNTNKRDQAAYRSDAGEAQKGPERCRPAGTSSVTRDRVKACTGTTQDRRHKDKATLDLCA